MRLIFYPVGFSTGHRYARREPRCTDRESANAGENMQQEPGPRPLSPNELNNEEAAAHVRVHMRWVAFRTFGETIETLQKCS